MNRQVINSVAVSALLGFAPLVVGCSAAQGDGSVGSAKEDLSRESVAVSASSGGASSSGASSGADSVCTAPFTTPEQECFLSDGKLVCGPLKCASVTAIPTPSSTWTGSLPIPTPIAPPAALVALGCTWGVEALFKGDGNIWACPASASTHIPAYLGSLSCARYRPIGTPPCEIVGHGTTVDPNPVVGTPHAGWILVQEGYYNAWGPLTPDGGAIGGSCAGGCSVVEGE